MLSTPHYRIFLSNGKHPLSQLTAGQVFGEIRVLAKSRNVNYIKSLFTFHYSAWFFRVFIFFDVFSSMLRRLSSESFSKL